jgi:hypothetical protein
MAATAVNLRVNVSDISNLMDKAFEPESAIELAATMQRLGATQSALLDPLRLMDMAQNDPEEMMNQVAELGKQFVQFNEEAGRFEIAPGGKRQLMELEKQMGLAQGSLSKMALAGAELDDKLSKISFPTDIADEDTQKMIANMAEMKDGQYMIKFKDEKGITQEKNVTELKDEDIKAIAKAQSEAPKSMEEIAGSQLTTQESMLHELKSMNRAGYAIAGSKTVGDVQQTLRSGTKLVAGGLRDMQGETGDIRAGFDKTLVNNIDAVNKALSGEGSLDDVLKTATGSFGDLTTALEDNFKVAIKNAAGELNKFKESGNMFAETLGNIGMASLKYLEKHEKIDILPKETKPEENKDVIKKEGNDVLISFNPEDSIKMFNNALVAGTDLEGNKGGNQMSSTPQSMDVNIKFDVTSSSSNINTQQIIDALRDTNLQDKLTATVKETIQRTKGETGRNPINTLKDTLGIPKY